MKWLYNIGIWLYALGVLIAGIFANDKAIKWIEGRRRWRKKLKELLNRLSNTKIIWVHAASLGEYEQAKPVIQLIRSDRFFKDYKIFITFFSASGYEIVQHDDEIDGILYLPIDSTRNARDFIRLLRPSLAVFVKYDFWFNFLKELQKESIPTLFFSSHFRENQFYFKKGNQWQLTIMKKINKILTLNQESQDVLLEHGFFNSSICGDTRFDRVLFNVNHAVKEPLIENFKQKKSVLILGSSWQKEEEVLNYYLRQNSLHIKIIIAPHDVSVEHIESIEKYLPVSSIRFSEANIENVQNTDILIIDSIGILSNLYQYSDIVFIGGGFTNDLHNILEAAAFGNAVFYGNRHNKYPEAQQLINFGGAMAVNNEEDFSAQINLLLSDQQLLLNMKSKAEQFVKKNKGASAIVFNEIKQLI